MSWDFTWLQTHLSKPRGAGKENKMNVCRKGAEVSPGKPLWLSVDVRGAVSCLERFSIRWVVTKLIALS